MGTPLRGGTKKPKSQKIEKQNKKKKYRKIKKYKRRKYKKNIEKEKEFVFSSPRQNVCLLSLPYF